MKIVIQLRGEPVELTVLEARKLYLELRELFGDGDYGCKMAEVPVVPIPPPRQNAEALPNSWGAYPYGVVRRD